MNVTEFWRRRGAAKLLVVLVAVGWVAIGLTGCGGGSGSEGMGPGTEITGDPGGPGDNDGSGSPLPDAGQGAGDQTGDADRIEDVFFDYDRYQLRPDARRVIEADARYLMNNPQTRVLLEGHCDERGTNEYNLALGQRRADAVMQYLVDLGISASRLSTVSYGEEKPFAAGSNEAAWAENRRVHFVLR